MVSHPSVEFKEPMTKKHPPVHWIGHQPGDPSPILYFSGYACVTNAEQEIMERSEMSHRCISYAFLGEKEHMPYATKAMREVFSWCGKKGVRLFLDSGAFTVQQMLKKRKGLDPKAVMKAYALFVIKALEQGAPLDFYVTFDYEKKCSLVYEVTKYLQKEFNLRPTAVYHGDDSLDWFRRYVGEGHRIICVGRTKALGSKGLRSYYERVFEEADKLGGVALHGLMVTGQNVFRFPWYSVDSATWTRLAANGRLAQVDMRRKKVSHIRVSRVHLPHQIKDLLQGKGWDPKLLAAEAKERCIYNIREFQQVASDAAYLKARPRWVSSL